MSEDLKPFRYEPIALSNESTVVAEYLPDPSDRQESGYQSEAELEKAFIRLLPLPCHQITAAPASAPEQLLLGSGIVFDLTLLSC